MDYSKVVEKIKPSIAFILSIIDNKVSTGSGFVFEEGVLVTCNHVIGSDKAVIKIKFPDQEEFLDAQVVLQDIEHDLALLKFDDNTRKPLKKGKLEDIKEGIPVLFSGYPLNITSLTTHQGILSSISKDPTGVTTYLIDGTVNSGNSGCPLMDKDGNVIGVVNAKRREKNEILSKVEEISAGAVSIHNIDLIHILNALICNAQLGMGYAVPCSYIPKHQPPEIASGKDLKQALNSEEKND